MEEKEEHEDKYCSKSDIFGYLIAYEDDELVGGVELFKRKINYSNKLILLGGFGSLWVREDKRRQGIALEVLKRGMKILKKESCDLAYLCTDINKLKDLYSKVGFMPLGKDYSFTGKSGKKYIEDDGMIAPVNSEKNFKQIIEDNKPLDIGLGNW